MPSIRVVFSRLDRLPTQESLLSKDELARADRARDPRRREQRIASLGFVRAALSRHLEMPSHDVRIERTELDQPILKIPDCDTHFSTTHSGDYVAVAIHDGATVGVDLQKCSEFNPQLIKRVLTDSEWREFFVQANVTDADAFFAMWTLKEAVLKCMGTGFSIPMRALESRPSMKDADLRHVGLLENELPIPQRSHAKRRFLARRISIANGYAAHVAWPEDIGDLQIEVVSDFS